MKPLNFFCRVKILVLLFVGLLSLAGLAQNNSPVRVPAPVTPNAAALFKSQDRPVGSYTGTTPINIPLFSVRSGGLEAAVNLDYGNGGIKVEETASWAGLGWNLSAGGRVTRVMKGTPDDGAGMLNPTAVKPSQLQSAFLEDLRGVYWGTIDSEPDMYYFDVNGLSGKFFFNEQGEPQLVSMKPIRIEYIMEATLIKGWVITDEQGTKYYFGRDRLNTVTATDETSSTYQSNVFGTTSFTYISSWHLLEIRDLSGLNHINFSYVKNQVSFTTPSSSTMAIGGFLGSVECKPEDQLSEAASVTNETNESYLSTITFVDGRLVFESTQDRKDYLGGRRINAIKQYNTANQLIRAYDFEYGYFSSAGVPTDLLSDALYKRLKLKSLSESGSSGSGSLVHRFDYEETVNLPSRLSKAVDYWGYYNGKTLNSTFLPSGSYLVDGQLFTREDLADRRSDPDYAVANTLKRVTYPTGGSRQFLYEGNTALLEQDSQVKPDAGNYTDQNFHQTSAAYIDDETPSLSQEFTINTQDAATAFSFSMRASMPPSFEVRISHAGPLGSLIASFPNMKDGSVNLGSGSYKIEIYQGYSPSFSFDYLIGSWKEKNVAAIQVARYGRSFVRSNKVGGIRVRELIDQDPVSGASMSTTYQYTIPTNPGLSSGLLITPPLFAYKVPVPGCISLCTLSSSSAYPLSSEGGSYVVYPEVRTIQQNNGYVDRLYSFSFEATSFDSTSPLGKFPMIPVVDAGWMRNKLLSEKYHDNSGNLIRKNLSTGILVPGEWDLTNYLNILHTEQKGYKLYGRHLVGQQPTEHPVYLKTEGYRLHSQFTATLGTKDISYGNGGQTELKTEYDYYTEIGRPILKGQRTYLSDGSVRNTVYRYAFNSVNDFVFGLNAQEQGMKATLLSQHYMQPLETVVTVTPASGPSVVTGGEKTRFDYFNGVIQVASIKQYSSGTDFSETVFDAYHTTTGKLLQYHVNDGAPITILYSYNGQYPVAEIRNATLSAVTGILTSGTIDTFSGQQNPGATALASFLAPLRTGLPNAFITSYTHQPLVGMASQTDAKGMLTSYEYDSFNRLENIKDQNGDIIKNYKYGYADGTAGSPVAPTYRSAAVTVYKTKNNCTTGTGSEVGYTIPALKYTSTVSQAAADQLAQADAEAGAQANANSLGTCGTAPTGTVSLNYSLPGSVQFTLRITNTTTNAYTDHILSGDGVLNNITSGTVNLALSEVTASSTVYNFSLNGVAKSGNSTSYDNFSFTATANLDVAIPPVGGPHSNTAFVIAKTKSNCASGTGTSVDYPVGANLYTSTISVADANEKARLGEDAKAQANANALGGCTINGTTTYYNKVLVVLKSKNNCSNGLTGAAVGYTVPANTYSSTISVAHADQQAQADADTNAQNYANNVGSCAVTSGTFDLNYSTNSTWMFTIHVKDALGNTLNSPSIQGSRVLAGIPGGTGSITITPYPPDFALPAGMTFSYSVNGSPVQTSTPAYFPGLTLSGTVNVTVTQTSFPNKALTVTKTKNNCASGEIGSSVNYVVPAATYWAASQTAADQLAQANANANAQDYANTNGTCEVATSPMSVYYTFGAKLLIEVTHLTRNTTVSYTANGTNSGTTMYVPNGLSKVKITNLQSGKAYRAVLNNNIQIGSTIEYTSVNFPGYLVYLNILEVFSNAELNVSRTKNNCYGTHEVGSTVTYTVPAGKYTSIVSQTEADQLAQDDVDANAQGYANTNGTCLTVYYSSLLNISKTRNDCPSGQVGSAVNYSVYYGKYTSTISQVDADQKAITNEDANAQAYANANGGCALPPTYYSTYLSVAKTRNNCTTGYTGSSVNYVVNSGKYTSLISQADANQKAQADADANAQNYANTNGACNPPVTYYNSPLNVQKTRNNCTINEVGSVSYYYIPHGKYTSTISQADANQKAQADADANAQNYANTQGICVPKPTSINYSVPEGSQFYITITVNSNMTEHFITGNGTINNIPQGTISFTLFNLTENDPNVNGYKFMVNNSLSPASGNPQYIGPLAYPNGGVISLEIIPYP